MCQEFYSCQSFSCKTFSPNRSFSCYFNDEFVIGFEDESLEKGRPGFMAESYGYVTVDDVKICEAVMKVR